jgi:hypothetical protein
MCTQLRCLLFSLPSALAVAVAVTDGADARRYTPPAPSHAVHTEVSRGPAPAASALPQSGPLKIPNAALEPAGWGDLDGWVSDDHASAFATFYASCHPIVRAIAFRAESANSRVARTRLGPHPPARDARKRLGPDQPKQAARSWPDRRTRPHSARASSAHGRRPTHTGRARGGLYPRAQGRAGSDPIQRGSSSRPISDLLISDGCDWSGVIAKLFAKSMRPARKAG